MISKPFTNRSNCARAARKEIEKSGGKLTQADIDIKLEAAGYVYIIANGGDDDAEATDDAAVASVEAGAPARALTADELFADDAATTVVGSAASEGTAPVLDATVDAGGTVTLSDLDSNTWAVTEHTLAAAAANDVANANGLTIVATASNGEVVHTADVETAAVPQGEVFLCIAFPAQGSVMWASKLSKQLKLPVTIRKGETLDIVQVVESRNVKAQRGKAEGQGQAPRKGGVRDKIVALLDAPGGATISQLQRAAGWNTKPSSFYLKKVAASQGRPLVTTKIGKEPCYALGEQATA